MYFDVGETKKESERGGTPMSNPGENENLRVKENQRSPR